MSSLTLFLFLAHVAAGQPTLREVLQQGNSADPETVAEGPELPVDEFGRGTPRSAVEGFFEAARANDYERAAEYLFLGRLPRGLSETDGPRLARQLRVVLDKTIWIDISGLSRRPEGRQEDGLPASRDRVATIATADGPADILLHRIRKENGVRIWKFSSVTVAKIPALYDEFGYGPFAEFLPPVFFDVELVGLQLWQALGLPTLLVLAYLVSLVFTAAVLAILRRLPFDVAKRLGDLAGGPLRLVTAVVAFSGLEPYLTLPLAVRAVVDGIEQALLTVAITWTFLRVLDVSAQVFMSRMIQRGQVGVTPLLPPGRRVAQIVLVGIAGLLMLSNLGFNVTGIVAGLGVGGIAVALAAQKSIENLFGGITLYVDRPVRIGDFCRFGDLVGTVEEIGLRSTRVRTLDRTVVSVPNADFSNLQLDNYSRRDKFWYHPCLGLRYETTPEQIRYILVAVREMLYAHPKVDPDPARVRFARFSAYSLDLEVFAYVNAADYNEFLGVAEDLNLRIMDIVKEAGSSFAFPSQTTYVESGEPLSRAAADAVGARVAEWRAEKRLYLPSFPDERIEELKGGLPFPPDGSPAAPAPSA